MHKIQEETRAKFKIYTDNGVCNVGIYKEKGTYKAQIFGSRDTLCIWLVIYAKWSTMKNDILSFPNQLTTVSIKLISKVLD